VDEWSEATTGEVTLRTIAALVRFILSPVVRVLVYATSWGHGVHV
jgi:hypothetical protein